MVRAGLGGTKWRCCFANDFDHKKSAVYRRNWGDGILKTADVRTLTTKDAHQIIVKAHEELTRARITLSTSSTTQLIIDTA